MDVVAATSIVIATATVISSILVPLYLHHRKKIQASGRDEALTWEALNRSIAAERDNLQRRLDVVDEQYLTRIRELREDWERQMSDARMRIKDLESEVSALRRALRGPDGAL